MKSLLHYPGSKRRIAPWIIGYMPPHHSYLEPYFGGGGVLFEKTPSRIETINDLDGDVVNFFRVIRDPESRGQLLEWLAYTPYARQVYDDTYEKSPQSLVEQAGYFAVRSMQSYAYRATGRQGWKRDVCGRETAYAVQNWNKLPENLAELAVRLKNVQIENRPALKLIKEFDHENVLIYADPPYVLSTRQHKQYRYEMTDDDHCELLEVLCKSRSMIMISGYDCDLYNDYLHSWHKEQIRTRTYNSARVETIWMNYETQMALWDGVDISETSRNSGLEPTT